MNEANLWPSSGRAFIGASAGADSMLLIALCLEFLKKGRLKKIHVLHVNYGTRKSSEDEANFLREFSLKKGICFTEKKLKLSLKTQNFEKVARDLRYDFFYEHVKKGDALFLGHNLDDSFEWAFLSSLKTSNLKSRLGIPLKRGVIRRPLMSLSRHQIRFQLKKAAFHYFIDESNFDTHFERNFLRLEIIKKFKKRFPSYLKNYIAQSEKLASHLGLGILTFKKAQIIREDDLSILKKTDGGLFNEDEIILEMKRFSSKERGSLREQLKKLRKAQREGATLKSFDFSGGVKVFLRGDSLYLFKEKSFFLERLDRAILKELQNKITSQIPLDLNFSNNKNSPYFKVLCPYLFFDKNSYQNVPSRQKIDPLFPLSTSFALKNKISFQFRSKILKIFAKNKSFF